MKRKRHRTQQSLHIGREAETSSDATKSSIEKQRRHPTQQSLPSRSNQSLPSRSVKVFHTSPSRRIKVFHREASNNQPHFSSAESIKVSSAERIFSLLPPEATANSQACPHPKASEPPSPAAEGFSTTTTEPSRDRYTGLTVFPAHITISYRKFLVNKIERLQFVAHIVARFLLFFTNVIRHQNSAIISDIWSVPGTVRTHKGSLADSIFTGNRSLSPTESEQKPRAEFFHRAPTTGTRESQSSGTQYSIVQEVPRQRY